MKNCSRDLLTLLACAVLSAGLLACGGSSSSSSAGTASSGAKAARGYLEEDGDSDSDDPHATHPEQDDAAFLASYGARAPAAVERPIAAVVRSYYAASLAGNGASVCALLNPALATAVANERGQSGAGAGACAAAIAPVLAQQHQHLLAESPATMTVIGVYAKGNLGLVVLGFKHSPESELILTRAGGGWKVDALYDTELW
jgi:hypothetical protein